MERFKHYFAEQGLDAKTDIPKAIVLHEVIGLGFAIGFWSLCYTVQPSRTFMRPVALALGRQQTLERAYAASFVRAQHTIQRATWLTKVPLIGRCVTTNKPLGLVVLQALTIEDAFRKVEC